MAYQLIWCQKQFYVQNWRPSRILNPLMISKNFKNNFILFATLKNIYLEVKFV